MSTERRTPAHLLGIGPWAAGISWQAQPNFGLVPKTTYPALPLMAVPDLTSMGFTLRRNGACEAQVEIDQPRGSAVLFQEMITDLWWRRWEPTTGQTEPIGRFQAADVSMDRSGDRLRTSVTAADYRAILEDRAYPSTFSYAAGTAIMTILGDIIPSNAGLNLGNFAATPNDFLGNTTEPVDVQAGQNVGDIIEAVRLVAATPFDWGVELEGNDPGFRLWPTSRGDDDNITLADTGSGYTPITSWRRTVNSEDYANLVWYFGKEFSQFAALDDPTVGALPMGVRTGRASNPNLIQATHIQAAARKELAKRSILTASWQLTLEPNFWRGRDHIDLGDWIRIIIQLGAVRFDERHQVEEIDVKIPASGVEEVTLTLGNARVSTNPRSRYNFHSKIIKRIYNVARP